MTPSVKRAFDKLQLPVPQDDCGIKSFTDGALYFLRDFGLVIRVEKNQIANAIYTNHPLIAQPLFMFIDKDTRVEVLPAFDMESENTPCLQQAQKTLRECLYEDGLEYWDENEQNVGFLKNGDSTCTLSDGSVPIIIDRNAISALPCGVDSYENLVKKYGDPQKKFLPLRAALRDGLRTKDMRVFYDMCQAFKENGDTICGWEKYRDEPELKSGRVCKAADRYASHVKRHRIAA